MTNIALVCLDGYQIADVLESVRSTLAAETTWLITHVRDTRSLDEAERALGGLLGRGPGRRHARQHLRHVVEASEDEVRDEAARWLRRAGISAEMLVAEGRPEREIVRVAEERSVATIVLGGGRGLPGRYPGKGHFPLSPVARFVVDHARCDVLLLRRYLAAADRQA